MSCVSLSVSKVSQVSGFLYVPLCYLIIIHKMYTNIQAVNHRQTLLYQRFLLSQNDYNSQFYYTVYSDILAVIKLPLRFLASTTRMVSANPAIILFLSGKW